ncbi:hypothetical protein HII31_12821 [Pseudocercospora fuligena]|uniref:BTB domain-containing protein n=1 Tax=Pseudocercospora fuligena TaxID=685502 RepID=A0A8H6R7I6_9PEZI|nr:hypothetical protein HII31_12821 [Pseudocercospora fuligena]
MFCLPSSCPVEKPNIFVITIRTVAYRTRTLASFLSTWKKDPYRKVTAMADDATKLNLVTRLSTCPELSDFKIVCNGREFPVHRFVLSLHSDVFKRACVSPFMESSKRAISMAQDHETDEIRALVEYMYKFDYSEPSDMEEAVQFHVQMAVLADKWDVRGLKELATKKFTSMLNPHWSALVPAIKAAYTSQPIIAEMCKAVVKVAAESMDVMLPGSTNAVLDEAMLAHPKFAVDLVHQQARTKPANTRPQMASCPHCGTAPETRLSLFLSNGSVQYQCARCSRGWTVVKRHAW